MKKALIIYQSKTGITKKFGEEIGKYITGKGIEVQVIAVQDFRDGITVHADYLLLGCWTAGLMLLCQHPDGVWKNFAATLPDLKGKKVALFTTHKLATGSMFKNMKKLLGNTDNNFVELKSKKGDLSEDNKKVLDDFLK
jgi:flavodoxin